ncbi:hypothetical protein EMIT0P260_160095 [Pseudomonas sp. IT-P260]
MHSTVDAAGGCDLLLLPNRTGPDTSAGARNGHIRVTVRMNSKVAADVLLGPSVASSPGPGEKSCLTRLSGRQRRPL